MHLQYVHWTVLLCAFTRNSEAAEAGNNGVYRLGGGANALEGILEKWDATVSRFRPLCFNFPPSMAGILMATVHHTCVGMGYKKTVKAEMIGNIGYTAPANAADRIDAATCTQSGIIYIKCERGIEISVLLDVSGSLKHEAEQKYIKQEKEIVNTIFNFMAVTDPARAMDIIQTVAIIPFTIRPLTGEQFSFSPSVLNRYDRPLNSVKTKYGQKITTFMTSLLARSPVGLTSIGSTLKDINDNLNTTKYNQSAVILVSDFKNTLLRNADPVAMVNDLSNKAVPVFPIILDSPIRVDSLYNSIRDASVNKVGYDMRVGFTDDNVKQIIDDLLP